MTLRLQLILIAIAVMASGCHATSSFGKKAKTAPKIASTHVAYHGASNHERINTETVITTNGTPERKSSHQVVLASAVVNDAEPLAIQDVKSEPAEEVVESIRNEQSIDLATALMLTTGQNPQVAFARARIEEALAQIDRANALKLPSIRAGVNYNKHEGRIQDVAGTVIETSRGSYYSGLGANAVGAGSPAVPGIVSQFHVADAIFQPRIAQRTACARQAGTNAVIHDQLLATALAYNELLRSEQELSVSNEIVRRASELERTTYEFAKAGEGLYSDHDRARTEKALRRSEQVRAEETVEVASARLAELIRWDSSQRLVPTEHQLIPIHLVSLDSSSSDRIAQGLSMRPELAESRHLVGEAIERLKRERNAPLVPSILLAASYGGLGGGLGSNLSNYGDRLDADAVAFWELRQLGRGEHAARREASSRLAQARTRELAVMDRIAREIIEASSQVQNRRKQIDISHQAIEAAQESYERNWTRIRNGQGLPIEVLQSLQALALSEREYVKVVAEYNSAQFTLQRSLGWPIEPIDHTH
jgi:outer membrane protein TolC